MLLGVGWISSNVEMYINRSPTYSSMRTLILLFCLVAISIAKTTTIRDLVSSLDGDVSTSREITVNGQKVLDLPTETLQRILMDEKDVARYLRLYQKRFDRAVCEDLQDKFTTYLLGASCTGNVISDVAVKNMTRGYLDPKIKWDKLLENSKEVSSVSTRCFQDGMLLAKANLVGRKLLYIMSFDKTKKATELTIVTF